MIRTALVLSLCIAAPAVAAERDFPVGPFTAVTVSGPHDVVVERGPRFSVRATGSARELDQLRAEVRGGRLEIWRERSAGAWRDAGRASLRVTAPAISEVAASGSGNLSADGLRGESVSGEVSGSGNVRIAAVDARAVSLKASGSGDITASGRCVTGDFASSGSGNVNATNLRCTSATARASGSGNTYGYATKEGDVSASGAGNAILEGGAYCHSRSSGSGTARCR